MKTLTVIFLTGLSLFAYTKSMATQPPKENPGSTAAEQIRIEEAYIRAMPAVSRTSAAFMTLRNGGDTAHSLVAAESPLAKTVELHTHTMNKEGVHKMHRVEKIDIPANGKTQLKPGGLHIMLIDLVAPVEDGKTGQVTLVFEDGSRLQLQLSIKKVHHHH